jgi:4-amino-4-deoxy-L-arabinose transferase-like glycosyltransferase
MTSVRAWLGTPSTARDVSLLSMVVAILYLLTGSHPAFGSSNRYSEACREMVELGQWTVPHLGYVPYFEKPILTYWLGAASQWLFGGSDLATNLPAGVAALVSVLATYGLGRRLRGAVFGMYAALFLLTCGLFMVMASTLTTDPILSACMAVVWLAIWLWDEDRVRGQHWLWGFWVALGLAFLTKGPIAIVLAGFAIAGYAFLCGGLRGVFTTLWAMHPLRGLAVLLAINLPWSLAVWWRDPRFLEFFYVRINFQAFFDGNINHAGPWWYYGPLLAAYLAPYTAIAVPALLIGCWQGLKPAVAGLRTWSAAFGRTVPELTREQRARIFLASVVVFPLLFLSIAASKLGSYPLPLLPAMVLLVLDVLWNWQQARQRWWVGVIVAKIIVLQVAIAGAPWVVLAMEEAGEHHQPITLAFFGLTWVLGAHDDANLNNVNWSYLPIAQLAIMFLVGGLVWSCIAAVKGRLLRSLAVLGGSLTVLVILLLPQVDRMVIDLDGSRLMTVVQKYGGPRDPVVVTVDGVHDYELAHTLHRRLYVYGRTRELGMGHFAEVEPQAPFPANPYEVSGDTLPQHPWLFSRTSLPAAWKGSQRMWIVCNVNEQREFTDLGMTLYPVDHVRKTVLVTNLPGIPEAPEAPAAPAAPAAP